MRRLGITIVFIFSFFQLHATIWTVDSLNNTGTGSLRLAISSSATGDTIRFNPSLIASGSDSIVLNSEISFSKSLRIVGLYTSSDTLFISGGGTNRIFNMTNAGTVRLDSMVLVNGNATGTSIKGGAIQTVDIDSLLISNSFFMDNTSLGWGGAIFCDLLTINALTSFLQSSNNVFKGNHGSLGGAIYTELRTQIMDSEFLNNTANYYGGAIHIKAIGQPIIYLHIINSIIKNNSAKEGGGIYASIFKAPNNIPITIEETLLEDNTASEKGGGLFYTNTDSTINSIKMINSTIKENSAVEDGGGVYLTGLRCKLDLDSCSIQSNTAEYGGGIYASTPTSSLSISFMCRLTAKHTNFSHNSADNGGGYYAKTTQYSFIDLDSCELYNNVALDKGGAMYSHASGVFDGWGPYYPTNCSITNSKVYNNTANMGASFYISDTYRALFTMSNCEGYGNTANWGGVVQLGSFVTTLKIEDSEFHNNSAGLGGVSYSGGDSVNFFVEKSNFFNNVSTANGSKGGAIYNIQNEICNLHISESNFKGNSVQGAGGAIFIEGKITGTIENCTLDSNSAGENGGAISINNSNTPMHSVSLNLNTTSFTGNTAGTDGGAFSSGPQSNLTINNSHFENNTAQNGGAIFAGFATGLLHYGPYSPTTLSLNHSKITLNTATNGGGILCHGDTLSTVNINSSEISFNNGTGYGAGVANKVDILGKSITNITHSTIHNNTASSKGGALYAWGRTGFAYVNVSYSTIAHNQATNGGGIWSESNFTGTFGNNPSTSNISILNSTITGNNATQNGAAIYSKTLIGNQAQSDITIKGSIVALNDTNTIYNTLSPDIISLGHNIFSDSSINGSISTDFLAADSTSLNLGQLGSNGGTTPTLMPLPPSIALDAGDSTDFTSAQNIPIVGIREIGSTEYCLATYYTDVIVSCGPVTWIDGLTYYQSDTNAVHHLVNTAGCDSIVSLDLTINGHFSTDTITACDSLTWINGVTYYSSNNTAVDSFTNVLGCDSVIWLNLHILHSSTSTDTVVTCDSLTWINGITYFSSNNTATDTLIASNGCDSIITLNLTINNSNQTTQTITACNSYTWIDGNTYTSSNNTATTILTNNAGCDSIITLDLIINYPDTVTDEVSACSSYTWIDGITYTSSNNTATYTLTNTTGCDSNITLDLTINYPSTGTDVITACNSFAWIDGNTYTTSNNTATHTLTNDSGCDSIVTLDLTINSVSDISTTLTGLTITAHNSTATYQWLDCDDNFSPLNGETNQSFTATENGNYAVELTENGCIDTANCVTITTVGILENNFGNSFVVYPNPTDGNFSIDLGATYENLQITIQDFTGKLIDSKSITHSQLVHLSITHPAGIYIVSIQASNYKAIVRVVKE